MATDPGFLVETLDSERCGLCWSALRAWLLDEQYLRGLECLNSERCAPSLSKLLSESGNLAFYKRSVAVPLSPGDNY